MILILRCYKYKGMTVYVNGIGEFEKSDDKMIIWSNIYRKEGDRFKVTPESEFEKEAVLIEKKTT